MKIMKIMKYFFEFIFIYFLLIIFKIIGYKNASNLGAIIGKKIGPLFRSNSKIQSNLENSNIGNSQEDRNSEIYTALLIMLGLLLPKIP